MNRYPMVLYHATAGTRTVASPADAEALGKGWFESPGEAAAYVETVKETPTPAPPGKAPVTPPPAPEPLAQAESATVAEEAPKKPGKK